MNQLLVPHNQYHQSTKLSELLVKIDPNYVDSSTQPNYYKTYPHFYRRVPLDLTNPIHNLISLSSRITAEKIYKNYTTQLRVIPSSGGLYPTEIYVQIRQVKGMIDGLYHLEIQNNTLTLIYELIDDGLENYICQGKTVKGLIFLISCAYFRSSWKYKNRSLRYCFLDSGHHIGAIEAAAYAHNKSIEIIFDFDKLSLNQDLGFENKEFITSCVIIGNYINKERRRFRLNIPFVSPTDYFEANLFIEKGYQDTITPHSPNQILTIPQPNLNLEQYQQAILNRRSARYFRRGFIDQTLFRQILTEINQPIPSTSYEKLDIYYVVHRVNGIESGIYLGTNLIKPGDFSDTTGYLCVNQRVARDSSITLFFTSHYTNYQTALQLAGLIGHRIYLIAEYLGIKCTGIGAYYDDEVAKFLNTEHHILYAMAIGVGS